MSGPWKFAGPRLPRHIFAVNVRGPQKPLFALAIGACWLAACSSTPVIEGPAPALLPPPPAEPPPPPGPPEGKLYREDVIRVVEAGFPNFLEMVDVEAHVRDGKFVGWTLVSLRPREFWAGVDLRPGDVVTSVNGRPIERETQAFDCFQSLKSAPRLVVTYLRGGVRREIAFDIIPRPPRPELQRGAS